MSQSSHDILALFILIAGLAFSPDAAAIVGPYVAIIIASSLGASFAVAKRNGTKRSAAMWYFLRVTMLACLISGFCATLLAKYSGNTEGNLLIPVAFSIGFVGDDWPGLLEKIKRIFFTLIDNWRSQP